MHESTLKVVGHFACWSHCARARAPGGKPERRAGMTMRGPQVVRRCETQADNDLSLSNTVVLNP